MTPPIPWEELKGENDSLQARYNTPEAFDKDPTLGEDCDSFAGKPAGQSVEWKKEQGPR